MLSWHAKLSSVSKCHNSGQQSGVCKIHQHVKYISIQFFSLGSPLGLKMTYSIPVFECSTVANDVNVGTTGSSTDGSGVN